LLYGKALQMNSRPQNHDEDYRRYRNARMNVTKKRPAITLTA